jgi:hypothetical protein
VVNAKPELTGVVKNYKVTETNIYRLGVWAQDLETGLARLQKQKSCVLAYCENLQKLRAVLKCLPEWILTGECKVEISILNAQRPTPSFMGRHAAARSGLIPVIFGARFDLLPWNYIRVNFK